MPENVVDLVGLSSRLLGFIYSSVNISKTVLHRALNFFYCSWGVLGARFWLNKIPIEIDPQGFIRDFVICFFTTNLDIEYIQNIEMLTGSYHHNLQHSYLTCDIPWQPAMFCLILDLESQRSRSLGVKHWSGNISKTVMHRALKFLL